MLWCVCAANAVDGGVAQVDVGAGHVDLGSQHHAAVGVLAVLHFSKAGQVLGRGAAAKRAVHTGFVEVASVGFHVFGGLLVHIGQACFDQKFCRAVHEAKIVAGLVGRCVFGAVPVKAQPFDGVDDGVDVLGVFFFGVGVVKAQVAHAAVVLGQAKVQANAFGVANV